VEASGGHATISQARDIAATALRQEAEAHPLFAAVAAAFPGARITRVRSREELLADAAQEALPGSPDEEDVGGEADDHWDPFEDHC
jgi:DNA polymerase III subunit gamma/tau